MSIFAISINFGFIDAKGKTSSSKLHIPTGLTIAQITAFGASAAQVISDYTSCQLTGVRACIGLDLSGLGLVTFATAQSDVAEKGQFLMRTAGNTYSKMILPTIAESLVVANSDALDTLDVDVAAFITALDSGLTTVGGVMSPVDLRDNDIVEVTEARETFRRFTPRS